MKDVSIIKVSGGQVDPSLDENINNFAQRILSPFASFAKFMKGSIFRRSLRSDIDSLVKQQLNDFLQIRSVIVFTQIVKGVIFIIVHNVDWDSFLDQQVDDVQRIAPFVFLTKQMKSILTGVRCFFGHICTIFN